MDSAAFFCYNRGIQFTKEEKQLIQFYSFLLVTFVALGIAGVSGALAWIFEWIQLSYTIHVVEKTFSKWNLIVAKNIQHLFQFFREVFVIFAIEGLIFFVGLGLITAGIILTLI